MLDPKDKTLQPPVRRSWLRLRLGKAYYAGKRYLLWCSARFRWAKERQGERLPCIQSAHATPLLRHLRGDQMAWQRNKVVNLKLAVARLDGLILHPGEIGSSSESSPARRDTGKAWCCFWGRSAAMWAADYASFPI